MRIKDPILKSLIYFSLGYLVISPVVWLLTGDFLHAFLIWNLVLSLVPLFLAKLIEKKQKASAWVLVAFSLAWLLFFPNSFYMITDLLYLGERHFAYQVNPYAEIIYSTDYLDWLALLHIFAGVLTGVLAGTYSLFLMVRFGEKKIGKKWTTAFFIIVCFLSSLGIYIGRFFRYNSWHILEFWNILSDLFERFGWFTVLFVGMFTVIHLFVYFLFCPMFGKETLKEEKGDSPDGI